MDDGAKEMEANGFDILCSIVYGVSDVLACTRMKVCGYTNRSSFVHVEE